MSRRPTGISRASYAEWNAALGCSTLLEKLLMAGEVSYRNFRRRYERELDTPESHRAIDELARRAEHEAVTLLCGCAGERTCHTTILADLIEARMATLARVRNGHRPRRPRKVPAKPS